MKPKAIIFDIDGTLATRDTGPGGRGPYDWDRVGEDTVNEEVMFIAKVLAFTAFVIPATLQIVMFSGRDERARYPTELWLDEHYGYPINLHMRPEGDNRPDHEVKWEMLQKIRDMYSSVIVFDDRNQVVDMWRREGFTCMQVCSREDGEF